MKFAIVLLAACVVYTSAQAQPVAGGVNPFAAANPYAAAFNPYFGGNAAAGGAQPAWAGGAAFNGFSISRFFQTFTLQRQAETLLTQPDFPADLAQRVEDVVANANAQAECDAVVLPWLQTRCLKQGFTLARNELTAIDNEWQARVAAASPAPASAPAAKA